MNQEKPLNYDPQFVEDAVFLAARLCPEATTFESQRISLYEIADPEERERASRELHRVWFARLALGDPIEKAVGEQPLLASSVKGCVVARAVKKAEEGAELFVRSEEGLGETERKTVRILLRPESLLDPAELLTFLRHELLHITDMLDPGFGYEPLLPGAEGGTTHDRLLKDRYRILWDVTIDGRMVKRGWARESLRAECFQEFYRAFPMLGEQAPQAFSGLFDGDSHSHAELVAFACDPRAALKSAPAGPHLGSRCPLCAFPTYVFEPKPEFLPAEVIAQITQEFPQWRPSHGLCAQCADLYRVHTSL